MALVAICIILAPESGVGNNPLPRDTEPETSPLPVTFLRFPHIFINLVAQRGGSTAEGVVN